MSKPHGGVLINRVLSGNKGERISEEAKSMSKLRLNEGLRKDVENIASGVYSPLEGFLCSEDIDSIIDHDRLANDIAWTIPIVLDMDEKDEKGISVGDEVVLQSETGEDFAIMNIEEIYSYDKKIMAKSVYGTTDNSHPGVQKMMGLREKLVGGKIVQFKDIDSGFERYNLKPMETRILFKEKGWRSVVGFQTRNVPHLGHEYVQKTALTFVDGIFINPIIGEKKAGDFRDDVILDTYQSLIDNYYLKNRAVMSILQAGMKYAGPKEAIFHAIIRKNYGCSHFIVGRDHAGVGNYYGPYAAQDIFESFPDIGITPVFFKSFTHCSKCGGAVDGNICPHDEQHRENFSGTKMRQMLVDGTVPPSHMMRPEVAEIVIKAEQKFVE